MKKENYIAYCEAKYLRISPYKVRKVADIVRGMKVVEALKILKVQPQKAASFIYKSLHSAFHNALSKGDILQDELFLDAIIVDESKSLKRFKARARGRAFTIIKRSCNIKIGLNEKSAKSNKYNNNIDASKQLKSEVVGDKNGTKS